MKRQIIILIAVAAIFAACSKVDNNDLITGNTGDNPTIEVPNNFDGKVAINADAQSAVIPHPANINFQLYPAGGAKTVLQWHTGYINVSALTVDGYEVVDGMKQQLHFETSMSRQLSILKPGNAGTIIVAGVNYSSMYPSLVLTPLNSGTDITAKESAALYLKGFYLGKNNDVAPVCIEISQQVKLTAEWARMVAIQENHDYSGQLFINISNITNGITDDMLKHSQRTADGMIIINSSTNSHLYQLILNNLQGSLATQFL
ncbi:MAG: hypothetical protein K0Q79_122 [Flavipsychrobacter sp.]|jgi:hypothetical protein|nr:hypothetical protein [Flavipsychrobacter sp.]